MFSAPNPFSFVLFGASGHLAQLKIYPALYILALKDRLPEKFNIVGYSRSDIANDAFRELVEKSIRSHIGEVHEEKLQGFLENVHYVQGQYDQKDDFAKLAAFLDDHEQGWKDQARLAYFSVPPSVFADVSRNLCEGGVHREGIDMRCIVEKPVGNDLASFEVIRDQLTECFEEDEIYLLDHYLGKEAVRNVYYLRYANPILERIFKNTLIHHVEITAFESKGLENRAGYFENTGTFRDMFQSHLLMVMSLLTMRLREEEGSFRDSLTNALEQIYIPPATSLDDVVLQGQYTAGHIQEEEVGYREEKGVEADSRTNTYAALKLLSRTSRWQGVPFYLRSGKRLEKKETSISIVFQEPQKVGAGSTKNRLDVILQGEAGMRIHLQTKIGGVEPEFRPLILTDPLVCHGDCLPEHGLMLLEAIHGRKQWFLNFNDVRIAWRLIDPLQTHLDNPDTPLFMYPAGSRGPKECDEWLAKDGIEWVYL